MRNDAPILASLSSVLRMACFKPSTQHPTPISRGRRAPGYFEGALAQPGSPGTLSPPVVHARPISLLRPSPSGLTGRVPGAPPSLPPSFPSAVSLCSLSVCPFLSPRRNALDPLFHACFAALASLSYTPTRPRVCQRLPGFSLTPPPLPPPLPPSFSFL